MKKYFVYILLFSLTLHVFLLLSVYNFDDVKLVTIFDRSTQKSEEKMINAQIFFQQKGIDTLKLNTKKLEWKPEENARFDSPEGVYFSKSSSSYNFKALRGIYDTKKSFISLEDSVFFSTEAASFNCMKGEFDLEKERFTGKGEVFSETKDLKTGDTLKIKSEKVISIPKKKWAQFDQEVSGEVLRKRKYEDGISFSTSKLTVNLINSVITLNSNVKIKKFDMDLSARNSKIFLENYNKKLQYFELIDDVVINQKIRNKKTNKLMTRKAFAENVLSFNKEQKVVLTGAPRVISGADVIRGSKIILYNNIGLVEVVDSTSRFDLKSKKVR